MELISKDDAVAVAMYSKDPVEGIMNLPTMDPDAEVVHGRWIKGSNVGCGVYFRCSACGVYQFLYGYLSEDAPTGYKYCPNCGAKMDLEGWLWTLAQQFGLDLRLER